MSIIIFQYFASGKVTIKWVEALGVPAFMLRIPMTLYVAILLTILIMVRARWFWKAAAIAGFLTIDLVLFKMHIMQVRTYWHFVYLTVTNVLVLLIGQAFVHLVRKNEVPDTSAS
ncbi:hypothetical protein ICC18_10120 [Paenibacillus sp. WST5]|uniref:Uncharacterized protein n=2 Tax=Paenibacillus sedimenti TaxID=2770274 RepID=A0A926QIC3_9BACL|nr:hypothetical protein [Paenibacillus sedimenti]